MPTNLDAQGRTTGASVNPPGFLAVNGPDSAPGRGDLVHQLRLFIEVTGTTLDIRVFDPGNTGARDEIWDGSNTRFQLFNPSGTGICCSVVLSSENAVLTGTTDNRLVRFTPNGNGFYQLDDPSTNNVHFSGLSPGVYEFRITQETNSDTNLYGVDIRASSAPAAPHYNVYTIGRTASPDSAMLMGTFNTGSPPANITPPALVLPYVTRGCTIQTSNFDSDGAGPMSVTDVLGVTTALTVSANEEHEENTVTVENAALQNLESANYGIYSLRHTLPASGSNNFVDWRVADFTGWTTNPGNAPRNPANPVRMYLPNGYAPVTGNPNAVLPPEPILAASTRVVSGPNPPVPGSATRFLLTATVENCFVRNAADARICDVPSSPSTAVQITIPIVAGAVYVAGTQAGFIDGVAAACTDGSAAGFRRCTFPALAAGSAASLNIEVNYTPPGSGLRNLTGPPAAGSPPPNTTVWAQYTPAFNSAAFPRTEVLGPLCNLVINVGGSALPTRATVRGLRVDPAGGVEFAAGSQQGTVAYNLHASDATGAGRRRINRAPVVAVPGRRGGPAVYRVPTEPLRERFVLVEEIDLRGRSRWMGPFPVDDAALGRALDSVQARLARLEAAGEAARASRAVRPAPEPASPLGIKIEVDRGGIVRLPLGRLGLPPSFARGPRMPSLTSQGQAVPFRFVDGARGPSLEFVAEALSTDYTGHNVYVLSLAEPPHPRVALTRSEQPPAPGWRRVARHTIYAANAPQWSDPWLWDLLFGDGGTWPYDDPALGAFDLPGLAPGPGAVRVRVRVVGRTEHTHHVSAAINGAVVASLSFDGARPAVLGGFVARGLLQPTGNRLTLTYSAEAPPGEMGLVYLDALDLELEEPPPVEVDPVRIAPYDPGLPDLSGVQYLVVTHPLFRAQAERIADLKRAQGLAAAVVDVERAYDAFSGGVVEAQAVSALLHEGTSALQYVLLVGDDTFDTRDFLGLGAATFVPSLLAWDGEFGRVPSENLYADLDGDGAPELAIGRLPVASEGEAEQMAARIERQEQALQAVAGRHVFAVDDQDPQDISFRAQAQMVADRLPPGSQAAWADVAAGVDAARAALRTSLTSGVMLVHYFGHAGPEVWADEALLTVDDVRDLAPSLRDTVVLAWACEAQWYQNVFDHSVAEALLLEGSQGALAAFGPAGVTDPSLQPRLYQPLYRGLARGLSLGEAIRSAKADALAAEPFARPVVEGWNLLGDPALRLPAAPAVPSR